MDDALRLANAWQRGFPLAPRPFADIGFKHKTSEQTIIGHFRSLKNQGILDRIAPGHDEPQVVAVLALVVVVDAGLLADESRDLGEALGRHRHRRKRARADGIGAEDRADPVDDAQLLQGTQRREGFVLGNSHPGERPRVERKAALPAIHEREIDRVEHQNPVIAARAARKMPLGFAARSRAVSAKLAVS